MNAIDAAYIAGLIDGEGSIGLFVSRSASRPNAAVLARLKIGMCDEALIRWLRATTQSGTVTTWKQKQTGWKQVWVATWNGYAAADLIQHVKPYLRLKRGQADILCQWIAISKEWRTRVGGRARGDRAYPAFVWAYAEELGKQIRVLNHRGTPYC